MTYCERASKNFKKGLPYCTVIFIISNLCRTFKYTYFFKLHIAYIITTIYIYIHILLFYYESLCPFIPSRNLDEVFTYNHMALMSLRCHSHVKASMV